MSQQIPLTQGQVAIVDDEDYDWLMQWHWCYISSGYAGRTIRIDDHRRVIWMHREIMGAQPGELVDHINGDRLCNTRDNLRIVDRHQNQWNRRKNATGSSPFKGVSHHRKGWHARIRVNGRRIHLGYYLTPELAARVYDAAAYRLFGVYAAVNFPDEPAMSETVALVDTILARHEGFLTDMCMHRVLPHQIGSI